MTGSISSSGWTASVDSAPHGWSYGTTYLSPSMTSLEYSLSQRNIYAQFEIAHGKSVFDTPSSDTLQTKTFTYLPKQVSEKKVASSKIEPSCKRSLNSEINKKLFVDVDCTDTVNETTNTLQTSMLKCCTKLTDSELKYVVDHFPNLIHLDLSHCSRLTDKGLMHLQKLRFLQHLDLSFCFDWSASTPNITDKGLSCLANLPLQYLDLDRFENITDKTIDFLKKCPLEFLCINKCRITGKGLSCLSNIPSFKILEINYCKTIRDNDLSVLKQLSQLKELGLCGCEKLSISLRQHFTSRDEILKI